jgi:hypothetical protein
VQLALLQGYTTAPYGIAVIFFVKVFVPTLLQHIYFFKDKEKNKRAVANTQYKILRQKNCLKLNNIMCVIVFFSPAHTFGML